MRKLKQKKKITPLHFSFYFLPVIFITLTGFFDSIYLAISHYRNYVDMGYQSFCAISKALNCDTVSQSPYSIFLNVPVPVWGILGYGFVLFLLTFAWQKQAQRKRIWTLLLIISLSFSIYSVILAFISSYYIHSYCIMCILSYAVNLALLFYAWMIRKRFLCEPIFTAVKKDILYLLTFPRTVLSITCAFAVPAFAMILFFPPYWHMDPPELSINIPSGITEDGHPWIGSESPELEIVEFSDYRCFQCKKMHYFLRRLIEAYPDKIRLIHRQFPMDHTINPLVKEPFHSGAAKLSIVSLFALERSKFWEMNDVLFEIKKDMSVINLHYFAEKTGIAYEDIKYVFRDLDLWMKLRQDIADGLKYGIPGTPGFVVNNQVYLAQIPADIMKPYLK